MIDVERLVSDHLERRVPPVDPGDADWLDVRRRAGRGERKRRILVAATAAALAAVMIATPALGIGDRLLDFFGLAAPPSVRKAVTEASEPSPDVVDWLADGGLDVDTDTIRGIATLSMPNGRVQLWGADARNGTLRVRFVQMPGGGRPYGILTGLITTAAAPPFELGVAKPYDYPRLQRPVLHGQVNPPVGSVRILYPDGVTQPVRIVDGYFLEALDRSRGSVTIEVRNRSGDLVGAETADLDPPKPSPPPRIEETRTLITVPIPGATASLLVRPGPNPGRCYRVVAKTRDSMQGTGSCPGLVGRLSYGFQQFGNAPDATVLLVGAVAPTIVGVRVLAGGEWIPVPLEEHFFLVALRPDQRPSVIETTSRSGIVDKHKLATGG